MKDSLNALVRRITLKQLRVLQAVVQTGTQSGAADALAVTPPAVALQLRQLEATLAVPLVERGGDGFVPSDAGREVLAAVERIEAALRDCADALEAMRGMERGRVSVGVVSTAKYFAPKALTAFMHRHPGIDLRVLVGNRRETMAALRDFTLDLAITGRPPEDFEIDRSVIGPHPHLIVAAPEHPFVGRRGLRLDALAGELFLLREEGSGTRVLMVRLFEEAGLTPAAGVELGSNETIKQAVMAGMGIALLSAHTMAIELREGRLAALDVMGLPIVREWYVVKRREKRLLPAAQAMWDHLVRTGGSFLPKLHADPTVSVMP